MRAALLTARQFVVATAFALATACSQGPLPEPQKPLLFELPGRFPSKSDSPWPLDVAIRVDRIKDARELLNKGANPNERWGQGGDHHPLQELLDSGGYEVRGRAEYVRLLLAHGADPNLRWCPFESRGMNEWGPSCTTERASAPLHFAAALGDRDVVDLLLRAGADASVRDWTNGSALDYAYDEVIFEMLSRSLFPDLDTRDQKTLAWLEEYEGRFYVNPWQGTPLARAVGQRETGYMTFGLRLVWTTEGEYRREAERQGLNRVRTLIRVGADPSEPLRHTDADWTPLAMALGTDQYRIARVLLDGGADVNQRWCVKVYRHWSQEEGPTDPRCTPQNGMTPLMWSAAEGKQQAVELLLEYAADVSLKDGAGRSAADVARTDSVRRLIEGHSPTATPPRSR